MVQHRYQLPKIPGLYQSFTKIKRNYPIGTDLEVIDNVRFIKSIERRNECDEKKVCDPDIAIAMLDKNVNAVNKRSWMVLDKEVLTFDAYYKYMMRENVRGIKYDIKKLNIIYFLVDETMQVNEPVKQNSGTPQGCFIKKQKIPLPGCNQDTGPYYKLTDLVIGGTVDFYGKQLKITGADKYTRDFLHKIGITPPKNEPMPEDPYFTYRKLMELDVTSKVKSISIRHKPPNGMDGFLLRFRGYWDDRYEVEGELRFFNVLYYLEDDTIELQEELCDETKENGITYKVFLKRQKLPKNSPWYIHPGQDTEQEVLNVISNGSTTDYYKMDSRLLENIETNYYRCSDLYIGATLNVFNRPIILVNCDEFTKDFYKHVYNLERFNPITAPQTLKEIKEELLNKKKQETILKNQNEVQRKRLLKSGGSGMVFGFIIKMITDDPVHQARKFMLKYYLDDTEFAVYEFREINSGLLGGMFRRKRKNKNEKDVFIFHQLTVGANITIDEFKFTITDVDDKTLKFMINNPNEFPHSNHAALKSKALELISGRYQNLDEFQTKRFQDRELVEREEFRNTASLDGELNPHAVAVFAVVHKCLDQFEPFSDPVFRSVVQDVLRKVRFIHFDGLRNSFRSRKSVGDPAGFIGRRETIKSMKTNNIPLNAEMTDILLDKHSHPEHGLINYVDLVNFMDYITNPVEPPTGLARDLLFVKSKKTMIKAKEFIDSLRTKT